MDKLSKAQKDELATSFAVLALYDGGVSYDSFGMGVVYVFRRAIFWLMTQSNIQKYEN